MVDSFFDTGTPAEILTAILSGTNFTVGNVEFVNSETFQFQQAASRRALLMKFAAYVGGELQFNGLQISLLSQRGTVIAKVLTPGKDITVISKTVNKRVLDESGNPQIAYTCGVYKGTSVDLGDVVSLSYDSLDINISLRIVSKSYDPFNPNRISIEVGNFIPAIEDDLPDRNRDRKKR
jgi:phage-related protein